ncbi:MAG: signal peptidase II [Nitrospirae bacterium]|nr:MAG: signal peptidase II [Nitrospirota bacterium]
MATRYAPLLTLSPLVVLLDQWTKALVTRRMVLYQSHEVVRGWFAITYIQNRGAVFGFLAQAEGWWRTPLFLGLAAVAVALLAYYYRHSRPEQTLLRNALALVLGGAVGNVIDRIRLGYVVDFLDCYWHGHHWPAFNLADAAITTGIALMLLDGLLEGRRRQT